MAPSTSLLAGKVTVFECQQHGTYRTVAERDGPHEEVVVKMPCEECQGFSVRGVVHSLIDQLFDAEDPDATTSIRERIRILLEYQEALRAKRRKFELGAPPLGHVNQAALGGAFADVLEPHARRAFMRAVSAGRNDPALDGIVQDAQRAIVRHVIQTYPDLAQQELQAQRGDEHADPATVGGQVPVGDATRRPVDVMAGGSPQRGRNAGNEEGTEPTP